jgi:hypothetical protein
MSTLIHLRPKRPTSRSRSFPEPPGFAAKHRARDKQQIPSIRGWGREAVLNTIAGCLARLDSADWTTLRNELLPIATTKRWDGDFENALRTLLELARRSDEAKVVIGDALLPAATSGIDLRVAALAKEFGRSVRPDGIATVEDART